MGGGGGQTDTERQRATDRETQRQTERERERERERGRGGGGENKALCESLGQIEKEKGEGTMRERTIICLTPRKAVQSSS